MASSDGLQCEEQTVLTLMLLTVLCSLAAAAVVRNTRLTYNAPRHIAKSRIVIFMSTYWSVGTLGAALLILLKADSLMEVILVVICFGLVALVTFVNFHVTVPSNQHGCCRVVLWSLLHTWMPWCIMWLDSLVHVSLDLAGGTPSWRGQFTALGRPQSTDSLCLHLERSAERCYAGYFWMTVSYPLIVPLLWLIHIYPMATAHKRCLNLIHSILELHKATNELATLNMHKLSYSPTVQVLNDARLLVQKSALLNATVRGIVSCPLRDACMCPQRSASSFHLHPASGSHTYSVPSPQIPVSQRSQPTESSVNTRAHCAPTTPGTLLTRALLARV